MRLLTSLLQKVRRNRTYYFDDHLRNEWNFYISVIRSGWTIIDAGANIGELTLLFSKFTGENGQVHAFEPSPNTFERLKTACEAGARFDNIKLNQVATSDTISTMMFHTYGEKYAAWNSFADIRLTRSEFEDLPEPEIIEVPTITLDAYCEEKAIEHIDLLKIDVEGAEWKTLNGARHLFEEGRIKHCVFEVGSQTTTIFGIRPDQFVDFFRSYHYDLRNITPSRRIFDYNPTTNTMNYGVIVATKRPGKN